MRFLLTATAALTLLACQSSAPDSDCPTGYQSPTYCLASGQPHQSCGPCKQVGVVCGYFEADLTCECDHQWHCSYCGGTNCHESCAPPDGGYACN